MTQLLQQERESKQGWQRHQKLNFVNSYQMELHQQLIWCNYFHTTVLEIIAR